MAAHLRELGVPAETGDVVTSAQAAATLVAERVPPGSAVLVVGGEGLRRRPARAGPAPGARGRRRRWRRSCRATRRTSAGGSWPRARTPSRPGLPWVATNMDATIPTPRGTAPGNGALVGVVARTDRAAAGRGRRQARDRRCTGSRCGAPVREHPLVVGDRLDTDIEGANRAGVPSLLVLTGVSRPADLLRAGPELRPTYLAADLESGLLQPHPGVEARGCRLGLRWLDRAGGRSRR